MARRIPSLDFAVYLITIFMVLAALAGFWAAYEFRRNGPLSEPVLIEVQRGSSMREIAETLEEKHVIRNAHIFMAAALVLGHQDTLKAGEYEFRRAVSLADVIYKLLAGETVPRRLTIREGLTSFEIVRLLREIELLEGEVAGVPPEGRLLPETYDYRRGEARQDVIERMRRAMDEALEELWPGRTENLPFDTREEALVLASIVEKETAVPEERKRVAGVFINRLRKNMPLQTDPTVIYAITKGRHEDEGMGPIGRRLLRKDLEIDSPYNTYKYPGLPPGPIANPGRASIAAVLRPEEHDYLYFVADGSGGHVFAKTLAEHNRNVARWRKHRRRKKE